MPALTAGPRPLTAVVQVAVLKAARVAGHVAPGALLIPVWVAAEVLHQGHGRVEVLVLAQGLGLLAAPGKAAGPVCSHRQAPLVLPAAVRDARFRSGRLPRGGASRQRDHFHCDSVLAWWARRHGGRRAWDHSGARQDGEPCPVTFDLYGVKPLNLCERSPLACERDD